MERMSGNNMLMLRRNEPLESLFAKTPLKSKIYLMRQYRSIPSIGNQCHVPQDIAPRYDQPARYVLDLKT